MKCFRCGNEMVEGKIDIKAISGNGLAFPLITFSLKNIFKKKQIRLKEKQVGYYCENCGVVLSEYLVQHQKGGK